MRMEVTDRDRSGHGSPSMSGLALEATAGSVPRTAVRTREQQVEAMFRAHYPFVRRVLRYWGTPPNGLEDAAQDVFAVVTRSFDRLRDDVDERSWLLGIARRVARNHRRSRLRHRIRWLALRAERADPPPSLASQYERAALAVRLLEALPERQRLVVVLGDLEGWTAPEIAKALGINLNTVYSRLRLARRRLEALRAEWTAAEEHRP
jgi:RNA polymerase sigma-70 factor, ECF subfamily